jgi:NADH pyrophosphatase NudC (nudix superfamily)
MIFWFIGAGLLGFIVGLLMFRVKSRWCPRCGDWTHPIATVGCGGRR